jgi:hypothetical protein
LIQRGPPRIKASPVIGGLVVFLSVATAPAVDTAKAGQIQEKYAVGNTVFKRAIVAM